MTHVTRYDSEMNPLKTSKSKALKRKGMSKKMMNYIKSFGGKDVAQGWRGWKSK